MFNHYTTEVLPCVGSNGKTWRLTPTATVRASPTIDVTATMNALQEEKLRQDIALDKSNIDKNKSDIFWAWTSVLTIFTIIGGIITGLVAIMRYFNNQQAERDKAIAEREKEAREAFRSAVEALGSEHIDAKLGAIISLRAFLIPGNELYYQRIFDLNASKKIMRHVLGPELERYLVQKAAIILFV
jgi:quinol-cytochrome oxidoreductase complex cytochrome b subunit